MKVRGRNVGNDPDYSNGEICENYITFFLICCCIGYIVGKVVECLI